MPNLPAAPPTARFDGACVDADGDRAVVIGPEGAHADALQRRERALGRVAVRDALVAVSRRPAVGPGALSRFRTSQPRSAQAEDSSR
jgi:hypothetical protein